ncbi:MAG TPA: nickel pincer cofactor biosynthesis protein LarC [bacterium]|jgi:uncharacterized protein (TIGR00299 family) protein
MRILFFDCYSGVSGDMILGALLDLGLNKEAWTKALKGLNLSDFDLRLERASRQNMACQRVLVEALKLQPERHLSDIQKIISASRLSTAIQEKVMAVFRCLAEAEAKIHGCTPEEVHFHEVGAVDAIVDVVGSCLALEMLKVDEIYSSPVGVGQGRTLAGHGPMPLPPPATLEILTGAPIRFTGVETELATPTGAALLKTLARFDAPPEGLCLIRTGYGAGSKVIPELPNVLRAILLEKRQEQEYDQALLIETNVDDMNPEIYPHVIEKLLEIGALDAYLVPIIMKKGRPGVLISVLCAPELKDPILNIIYQETTTLGVRMIHVDRTKLPRKEISVQTEYGAIKGKEARWGDQIRRTPEFEECRRVAKEKSVSLAQVYDAFLRSKET